MKLNMFILACLFIATFVSYGEDQINWYNFASAIVDENGDDVLESSNWIVRMYKSTDATINFSLGAPTADDAWLNIEGSFGGAGSNGYFSEILTGAALGDVSGGDDVYSVVFNNSIYGNATKYAILDGSLHPLESSFDPPVNYDTSGTIAGDWQAVPEPATAMLLALGGGLAWLVRLKQRMG